MYGKCDKSFNTLFLYIVALNVTIYTAVSDST